ncbi:putative LOC100569746 [Trichonephila clavipes]|nr:putative LOC100569746 [Trichonephila clavipes]
MVDQYRAMITNFFIPELNNHDVQELWFQQDGATCHTARATIDLLKDTFGDRLISRFGPVNWPPRSCDLTPLDYFLWDYVKSLVYADKPQTLDHLEDNIRRVIADIRPQMLEKGIENWTSRLDYIRASRGSRMPEIIFKTVCGFRHNTLLHRPKGESANAPLIYSASPLQGQELNPNAEEFHRPQEITAASLSCISNRSKTVILPTAVVWVLNHSRGRCIQARAVLDSNIVTLDFANKLGAPQNRINIPISSLGGNKTTVKSKLNAIIINGNSSFSTTFSGCLKNYRLSSCFSNKPQ